MAGVPYSKQISVSGDILSAWEAISNGVVGQNHQTREKYWKHWSSYTQQFNKDKYLDTCNEQEQIIIITAFAARVRSGHYGKGRIVKAQSVSQALAAISKTIELVGKRSPIYQTEKTYKTPVARLLEGYRREDPPSTPQLAVPVAVPEACFKIAYQTNNPINHAVGDLALIAFYYLLRVGEYTKPKLRVINGKTKRATRTQQFRVENIGFFKNNKILPRNSKLKELLTADSCTLKITNQKNGRMGQTIHHFATHTSTCPVQAVARRVHHILSNKGSTSNLICDVFDKSTNSWTQVTARNMMTGVRQAVSSLNLQQCGIDIDLVGVHSLRAGGAMALKLQGENDTTIMKMGRWTSLTFLQYIHNQIAHLSKGLATKMSTKLNFQNIAAIEKAK